MQKSQLSLGAINWLIQFERSTGRQERRSISVLKIAIKWLSECERSIGVLRMATNWLSDCESGGSPYVSRQAALHSCF